MHHPILPYQTSLPSTLSKPAAGVVVILAVVVLLDIVLLLGLGVVIRDVEVGVLVGPTDVEDMELLGIGQSPATEGTAFVPLPMGTRCEPHEAAFARWMFMLSWS